MQTANTLEFRNAVRTAAKQLGAELGMAWTDSANHRTWESKRYVGMVVYHGLGEKVAGRTEALLNAHGLTASTRTGRRSNYMVRGTCVQA